MTPIVIVGAGIAGLVCAIELTRAGKSVMVFEAEADVGGRVRTMQRDGCLIDRGFQVLFTAYPMLMSYLDADALDLRAFRPAAHVVTATGTSLIGDALRDPTLVVDTITAGDVPLVDKLRLLALRRHAKQLTIDECFASENVNISTRTMLERRGFSVATIDNFFAPFYGGILLDRTLSTNAGVLLFTFKMLSEGVTAVPARGMGAISDQLASHLPHGTVMRGTRVSSVRVTDGRVYAIAFDDGTTFDSRDVVLATDGATTVQLAATAGVETSCGVNRVGSTSLYFTADRAALPGKSLWLNADPKAIISHAVTLTDVVPEYAPGKHLLVATAIGDAANLDDAKIEASARSELSHMATVGAHAALPALTLAAIVRVPYSQFAQPPGTIPPGARMSDSVRGLWRASEVMHSSSLEGAVRGGRAAAMALLAQGSGTTS
jgi:predicted NAD/FAD-dependent oxidoreductase